MKQEVVRRILYSLWKMLSIIDYFSEQFRMIFYDLQRSRVRNLPLLVPFPTNWNRTMLMTGAPLARIGKRSGEMRRKESKGRILSYPDASEKQFFSFRWSRLIFAAKAGFVFNFCFGCSRPLTVQVRNFSVLDAPFFLPSTVHSDWFFLLLLKDADC